MSSKRLYVMEKATATVVAMVCIGNSLNRNNVQHIGCISEIYFCISPFSCGASLLFQTHSAWFNVQLLLDIYIAQRKLHRRCVSIIVTWMGYYEMRIFHWPQLKINHCLNGISIIHFFWYSFAFPLARQRQRMQWSTSSVALKRAELQLRPHIRSAKN